MTVRLGRLYEFSASHRLHAPSLSDDENKSIYGKCNNPYGHGHNYEVELTVRGQVDAVTGRVVDLASLDRLVEKEVLAPFRHRNLNEEVDTFRSEVPTTENLAIEVYRRLLAVWPTAFSVPGPSLEKVRIWETGRNICEVGI